MNHAALAHTAVKVAIGGRGTDFSFGQYAGAHPQTGAAARIHHAKTAVQKDRQQPFVKCLPIDIDRGRHDNTPQIFGDVPAVEDGGGIPEILDPAVGTGADIDLIDYSFVKGRRAFDLVRPVTERDLGLEVTDIDVDFGL